MRHVALTILVVLALAAPLALSQAGDTAPNYTTVCQGGATQTTYAYGIDDDMKVVGDTTGDYYLFFHPYWISVWEEANTQPGLQMDDRVCERKDIYTGQVLSTFVAFTADRLLVEGAKLV